jgi:hypothetical protein
MAHRFLALLILLMGASPLAAQPTNAPAPAPTSNPLQDLREISPGVLEYHGIQLDKKNHRISFSGTVNQRVGLVEYLLVNELGKVHESLFATKMLPHDIHLALLLIGLKDENNVNAKEQAPPSAIDSAYLQAAPKLKGAPVLISVKWTLNGKTTKVPAENWILNLKTNHPMTTGTWTYNGSMIQDGVFLADQELSIVAVITDPTALVNNPREGYDDDEIWQLRDDVIPPMDTPVEITITLAEPTSTKP